MLGYATQPLTPPQRVTQKKSAKCMYRVKIAQPHNHSINPIILVAVHESKATSHRYIAVPNSLSLAHMTPQTPVLLPSTQTHYKSNTPRFSKLTFHYLGAGALLGGSKV